MIQSSPLATDIFSQLASGYHLPNVFIGRAKMTSLISTLPKLYTELHVCGSLYVVENQVKNLNARDSLAVPQFLLYSKSSTLRFSTTWKRRSTLFFLLSGTKGFSQSVRPASEEEMRVGQFQHTRLLGHAQTHGCICPIQTWYQFI